MFARMSHAQQTRNTTAPGPPPLLPTPMARDKGAGTVKSPKSVGGAGTWRNATTMLELWPPGACQKRKGPLAFAREPQ